MLSLLNECHFWTMRDDIRIKNTDYGTFRYMRNRELNNLHDDVAFEAKRDYIESRDGITLLKNNLKYSGRLKDNLKRLEELLRHQKVIHVHWSDAAQVLLVFTNGIITHICIDIYTGDILRMVYERYLVGKLAVDTIADAFFTRSHIVLAYNTNQVTVVHLQKPNARLQGPEKIANMEPKIFHAIIPGTPERKLPRHLNVNSNGDMFVTWTKSSQNEVFPWRPTVRDQDCANIHVFKLKSNQLDFFSYCWSENDPLHVDFLRSTKNQIVTLEQKISRKGEIFAEICSYSIGVGKMQRNLISSISIGTQITCFAFSPDQEKLFLGSFGRNICLHDLISSTTTYVNQIDIIPTRCSWHSDSSVIIVSNNHSQFQCFDLALALISNQLQSEDVTPTNVLDLSHYFVNQPLISEISFSRKPELGQCIEKYAITDSFLLLLYDQGPIGCLRFFASAGMRGDIHNSGLTTDVLLDRYLSLNQLEKAVNLLYAINWETYGAMCLLSLHKIANHVFCCCDNRSGQIELMAKALKSFSNSLSEETKDEFSDRIFDLKRRFFFFLMRCSKYTEAFEVAEDIDDYDLFMDLYNNTKSNPNLSEFAVKCFNQAARILQEEDKENGNFSTIIGRVDSTFPQSTTTDRMTTNRFQQSANLKQEVSLNDYVPPLPLLKSMAHNAEMVDIIAPKLEMIIEDNTKQARHSPAQQESLAQQLHQHQEHTKSLPASTSYKKPVKSSSTSLATSINSNLANLTLKSGGSQSQPIEYIDKAAHRCTDMTTADAAISDSSVKRSLTFSCAINSNSPPYVIASDHTSLLPQRGSSQLQQQLLQQQQQSSIIGMATYQPKYFEYPLVSGNIPPKSPTSLAIHSISNEEYQKSLLSKKPTASILANGTSSTQIDNTSAAHLASSGTNGNIRDGNKNLNGEKNKVKFSDTVQVAVVPEISRKDKLTFKRNSFVKPPPAIVHSYTNPRKELADSLPLCHPNDEYLKDFNPLATADAMKPPAKKSNNSSRVNFTTSGMKDLNASAGAATSSIKVVHFGVV